MKVVVAASPSNNKCKRLRLGVANNWACCENIEGFNFHITGVHAGFGVTVLDDSTRPFRLNTLDNTYLVSEYEWNTSDVFPLSEGSNGQLLLLRLFVGKEFHFLYYVSLVMWFYLPLFCYASQDVMA